MSGDADRSASTLGPGFSAWLAASGTIEEIDRTVRLINEQVAAALPSRDWMRSISLDWPGKSALFSSIAAEFNTFRVLDTLTSDLLEQQSALFDGLREISRNVELTLRPVIDAIASFSLHRLPANWVEYGSLPDDDTLRLLVLDEGLPLAWTPPAATLGRLIDAPDQAARRAIIGRDSPAILRAATAEMDHITSKRGREHVRFARAAIASIVDGHREAGQALAANTIDSLVGRSGLKIPSKNNPPDMSELGLKEALVLGALWNAYLSYWPAGFAVAPPNEFRRHASAHAVSTTQYSLRNATLAVMHLTALMRWMEETGRFDD